MFLMHQIGRNETNKQVSWLIIRNVGEIIKIDLKSRSPCKEKLFQFCHVMVLFKKFIKCKNINQNYGQ